MLNMQPGGRFNLTKVPQNLPGKCVVCGAWGGDGRDFIDFGFDIDFYGTVYFCSVCFTEVANKLEYISPLQWITVNNMNDELIRRIQRMEVENGHLRSSLGAINYAGYSSVNSEPDPSSDVQEADDAIDDFPSESDVLSGKNNSEKGSDDSEFDGSFNKSGHALVPSNDIGDGEDDFGFDPKL